jgi:hypothetical protein
LTNPHVSLAISDDPPGASIYLSRRSSVVDGHFRFERENVMRKEFATLLIIAALAIAGKSNAQHFDVEIDPIAYALKGYSVHGGYMWSSFRLDIGIFGVEAPEFAHGNEGFANRIDGGGAKLDYYLIRPGSGMFIGLESGVVRSRVTWTASRENAERTEYSVGARTGYRFILGGRFTVTPWVGLGYTRNKKDQHVDGRVFESGAFQPFPTIHLGYKF